MPNITIIDAAGQAWDLDAPDGLSLMEIATANDIDGILAECGGNMVCTTCHVYLDAAWAERVAPPSAGEHDMLDVVAADRLAGSRLACQVRLDAGHEGLIATVAPFQH